VADDLILSQRTPYQVLSEQDIVKLRWYPPLADTEIVLDATSVPVAATVCSTPLVIVPPLAVNMSIYDLFPQRSLVRYLRARGFSVYLIDWGRPQRRHDRWNLETYIAQWLPNLLKQVRQHAGTPALSLHGWSFGGLLAYSYAALTQDPDLQNLILLGTPCDYHNNGLMGRQQQRLGRLIKAVGRVGALRPHAIPASVWRAPGWANSMAYKLTSPVASVKPHFDLLRKLQSRQAVAAHATHAAFVDDMVAYPGGVIQDTLQHLWADNVMALGRLPIAGSTARLSDVKANLLIIAGNHDPIVTPDCAAALQKQVSSKDQTLLRVSGGHMAIVSGKQAPHEIWQPMADWLQPRSTT
jgi:polyhydroxyalkanoate synthase